MTTIELHEAETRAIVRRAGGLARLKKKSRALRPGRTVLELAIEGDLRALSECGESLPRRPTLDAATEQHLREAQARVLLETTGDGVDGAGQLQMPPMTGWTAEGDGASTYSHAKHGRVKLGAGRWSRHDASSGRIVASGTTQESLTSHLRGLKDTGDMGNANAAESLDDVLRRGRGESPRPTPEAARLVTK